MIAIQRPARGARLDAWLSRPHRSYNRNQPQLGGQLTPDAQAVDTTACDLRPTIQVTARPRKSKRIHPRPQRALPRRTNEVLVRTVVAMSKFESSWRPNEVYQEDDGQDSVGLFELSIGDQNNYHLTPHAHSEQDLKDSLP